MKRLIAAICVGLLAVSMQQPVLAQGTAVGGVQRLKGAGINYAPAPAIYEVLSVDSYFRTIRVRAADGKTADVHVGDDIYDISQLKKGSRIQIDFLSQDEPKAKPKAASIWPAP